MTVGSILDKSGDGNQEPGTEIVLLGEYKGTPIHVRPSDQYVNATAMCKAAGKLWGHYWGTDKAKSFAKALSVDIGITISRLIVTAHGKHADGTVGTWVHPDIAVQLAQWCSDDFAIWVSRKIREQMATGQVAPTIGRERDEARWEQKFGTHVVEVLCGLVKTVNEWRTPILMIPEMASTLERHGVELAEMRANIAWLIQNQKGKRGDFSKRAVQLAAVCIKEYFNSSCLACQRTEILDNQGEPITKVWQAHHWWAKGGQDPQDMYPCCTPCHNRFTSHREAMHAECAPSYAYFQRWYIPMLESDLKSNQQTSRDYWIKNGCVKDHPKLPGMEAGL